MRHPFAFFIMGIALLMLALGYAINGGRESGSIMFLIAGGSSMFFSILCV